MICGLFASFHKNALTHEALLHHGLQNLHISAAEAGTKSFAEVFAHMRCNIDTNFITQCGYTHGKAEGCGESIQLLGVDSFLQRHINGEDGNNSGFMSIISALSAK